MQTRNVLVLSDRSRYRYLRQAGSRGFDGVGFQFVTRQSSAASS